MNHLQSDFEENPTGETQSEFKARIDSYKALNNHEFLEVIRGFGYENPLEFFS